MKRLLILSFSHVARDPRVMRQVRLFEQGYALTVCGFGDAPEFRGEFVPLSDSNPANLPAGLKTFLKRILGQFDPRQTVPVLKLLAGRFESYHWSLHYVRRAREVLASRTFDAVIANDVDVLPVALELAGGAPVLFDSHELAAHQSTHIRWWRWTKGRYYEHLMRRYAHRARTMVTVSDGIAEEHRRRYGLNAAVVRNAPSRQPLTPVVRADGRVRLIHHGSAVPERCIELFIDAMAHLGPEYELDLMLLGEDARYMSMLRRRAGGDGRIRFIDPVPMPRICETLNPYDVGLVFLPPLNPNHANCLPNKFFEYVQARLAVVTGPSPEIARTVEAHGIGAVADAFTPASLSAAIATVTPQTLPALKRAADTAAGVLCFEADAPVLRDRVAAMMGSP